MKEDIEKKIETIFSTILGNDEINSIDSVAYVELLITFQNEFKIKFTTQEFFTLRDKKNIKESLIQKILA